MGKKSSKLYVGMDVHKESIDLALAEETGEVRHYGRIGGDSSALARTVRKLESLGKALVFVYEAGPCGFVIQRSLSARGHDCWVVAPSNTPRRGRDRVKTDQRDCLKLAGLARAGELSAIYIPDAADEAMRDLVRAPRGCRCRTAPSAPSPLRVAAAKPHPLRGQDRLDPCTRALDCTPEHPQCGPAHRLRRVRPRRARGERTHRAAQWSHRGATAAMASAASGVCPASLPRNSAHSCRRIVAELGDLARFTRFRKLNARGLNRNKIVVAVARELAGFIWATAQHIKPASTR